MRTKYKVILVTIIVLISGFIFTIKNSYFDPIDNEWLLLNPFGPKQSDYEFYSLNTDIYDKRGDSLNYKYFSSKIVEFRNTYNEDQYENLFSDGNDFWAYKQKKILNYSKAYESIGNIDSAISCLKEGLIHYEKYKNEIDRRFFLLQVKTQGKDKVILEITKGVKNIDTLNCFMCNDHYFEFQDYKIGLDLNKYDRENLLSDLLKEYGM